MFTLPRLPEDRQRNVGDALDAHFKTKPKYSAEVMSSALAVIKATPALGAANDLPMFTIDVATVGVLSAIYRVEQAVQKGLTVAAIPLGPAQQTMLDAAVLLDGAWFPSGIGFIRGSVGVQNAAMMSIRNSLKDKDKGPAIKAAIKTLGLGPLVDHFVLHAARYAKKLGLAGEIVESATDSRDPSDVGHDLYVQLAIDVSSAYRTDPAKQKTLLGSYESQLAEYRSDQAMAADKLHSFALASTVGLAAGAALVVLSTVLFVTEPSAPKPVATARWIKASVAPFGMTGTTGASVLVQGTW